MFIEFFKLKRILASSSSIYGLEEMLIYSADLIARFLLENTKKSIKAVRKRERERVMYYLNEE